MNADKIRNLTDAELTHQQTELADQLFKLKFQLKMGQTESLKKIRDLKKDIARMYTIQREKQLAGGNGAKGTPATPAVPKAAPKKIKAKPVVAAPKAKKVTTPKAKKVTTAKKAAKKTAATEKK
jgi:large subunit ribosomal protein L29